MVPGLPTVVLTVIRAGTVTERGDAIPDWGSATEYEVAGCVVQPMSGEEVQGRRDAAVNRWKVCSPVADVSAWDRVRFNGIVCDVDSDVRAWPGAIPVLTHLEFEIQRVEG
ncbi:MAG: hypothetical protein ACRD0P_12595 [Stackebrandtia sp.]